MDFSNIPEPPSFERVQNDYSQKNVDLLKEIRRTQLEQIDRMDKFQLDSMKDSETNHRHFVIQTVLSVASLIASVVAAVAAIISLL